MKSIFIFAKRIKRIQIVKTIKNLFFKYHKGIYFLNSFQSNLISLVRTSRDIYPIFIFNTLYSMRTNNNKLNSAKHSTAILNQVNRNNLLFVNQSIQDFSYNQKNLN